MTEILPVTSPVPSQATRRWYVAFCLCFITVLLTQAAEALLIPGEGRDPNITIFFIKVIPLVIFIPGVLRRNPRTVVWVCFVILLYFMYSVTELMSPFGTLQHAVQLVAVVGVFVAGIGFVRASSSDRKAYIEQFQNDHQTAKPDSER